MKTKPDHTVTVAHDYQCPWCWISMWQSKMFRSDFPRLSLDWVGYELLPDMSEAPKTRPQPSERFLSLLREERLEMRLPFPEIVTTRKALEGAEFFKARAPELFDAYNETVYEAFWTNHEDISDMSVLTALAASAGASPEEFASSVQEGIYGSEVIRWDEKKEADAVTHLTTFKFKGEQCAEAAYPEIRAMAARHSARHC